MSWLSDQEIADKVKKNGNELVRRAFYGLYPIDELPKSIPHLPIFLVVNTHTHNLQGQHWKVIYIDEKRRGELFDSLAQPTSNLLNRWMNRFTRKWTTNRKVYQHGNSTTCGAFALYFILQRLNYPSLDSFTQNFSHSRNENERFVRHFYESLK